MGGNTTWEIEIGSERGLYKYINQAGTTKASTIYYNDISTDVVVVVVVFT